MRPTRATGGNATKVLPGFLPSTTPSWRSGSPPSLSRSQRWPDEQSRTWAKQALTQDSVRGIWGCSPLPQAGGGPQSLRRPVGRKMSLAQGHSFGTHTHAPRPSTAVFNLHQPSSAILDMLRPIQVRYEPPTFVRRNRVARADPVPRQSHDLASTDQVPFRRSPRPFRTHEDKPSVQTGAKTGFCVAGWRPMGSCAELIVGQARK